jgi:hypothetical protein
LTTHLTFWTIGKILINVINGFQLEIKYSRNIE